MTFPVDVIVYPSSGEEVHLRCEATCIASGTDGHFDPISATAEPPSGPEFDLSSGWEVEWPFESENWHPAPDWMIEELFTDNDENNARLDEALDTALAEYDASEQAAAAENRAEIRREQTQ